MARKLSSREVLLIAMMGLAVVVALFIRSGGSLGRGGGAASGEPVLLETRAAPEVHMARLSAPPEDYDEKARNLFAYYTPPRPKPRPKPPTVKKPTRRTVAPPVPTRAAAPAKPPPRARPPKIPFTYLGYLGPKDAKIAVFEEGKEMLIARSGDVVKDRFRVIGFKFESIVMGYTEELWKDETTELRMKNTRK